MTLHEKLEKSKKDYEELKEFCANLIQRCHDLIWEVKNGKP